jgi:hypothetical protein
VNALLTITEKKSTVFSGPEVSLGELQALVVSVLNCSAAPDAIAVYERLRGGAVDAYFSSASYKRCNRTQFLDRLFAGDEIPQASAQVGIDRTTGWRWATDFCTFASHWLRWRDECDRDDEARDLQCSESCGRKHFDGTTGGDKRTGGAKTKKLDRPNWTRCMDCPRRRDDVAVAMRGPGTAPAETGR